MSSAEKAVDIAKAISQLPSFRAQHRLSAHFQKIKPSQRQADEIVEAICFPTLNTTQLTSDTDTVYDTTTTTSLLAVLSKHCIVPWSIFNHLKLNSAESIQMATKIISNSKQYLLIANHHDIGSFTSISSTIAKLHSQLLRLLLQQMSKFPGLSIDALEAMVCVSPWESLEPGNRNMIYTAVTPYLSSEKPRVLNLYIALIETGHSIDILDYALRNATGSEELACVASLDLIATLITKKLVPADKLAEVLVKAYEGLESSVESIRVASYRLLLSYNDGDQGYWTTFVDKCLARAMRDESFQVRALACDILGNVTGPIVDGLKFPQLAACITQLLGALGDSEASVQASAVGTLGVFTTLEKLRSDPLFLSDLVHCIPPLLTLALVVRIRASWALANLCDALEDPSDDEKEALLKASLVCCKDNDKCKGNGVRALGCLWRQGMRSDEILNVLLKCASSGAMKTRWNSLHALGVVVDCISIVTDPRLITMLLDTIYKCRNGKVKISACLVL